MLGYAIPSTRSFAAFSRLPAWWDHHDRNQNLAQFRASFFCCTLFFFTEYFISLCFTIPLRIPPPTFPVESYTHKVFPFLVEWATFFVSTDEQILNIFYTFQILRDSRFLQRCWQNLDSSGTWRRVDWWMVNINVRVTVNLNKYY